MKDIKWEKKVDNFLEKIVKIQNDAKESVSKEYEAKIKDYETKISELEKEKNLFSSKIKRGLFVARSMKIHINSNTKYTMR